MGSYKGKQLFFPQCLSIAATYHLIQQTDPSQPTKLMILGPACSEPTILMGEIAERFLHIPQVCTGMMSLMCTTQFVLAINVLYVMYNQLWNCMAF